MLDHIVLFRKNGAVLWSIDLAPPAADVPPAAAVDALIRKVLLEERGGAMDVFHEGSNAVKWTTDNEMELVVAAVYQRTLTLTYVDELLLKCRDAACRVLRSTAPEARDNLYPMEEFSKVFEGLRREAEERAIEERQKQRKQRSFAETKKFGNTRQGQKESALGKPTAAPAQTHKAEPDKAEEPADPAQSAASEIEANRARLRATGGPVRRKKGSAAAADGEEAKEKEPRSWDGGGARKGQLDFSKQEGKAARRPVVSKYTHDGDLDLDADFGGAAAGANGEGSAGQSSSILGLSAFKSLVGGRSLTREELEPVLEALQARLVEKNVATDIGAKICESVLANLLGKQLGSFERLTATVRAAMSDALVRILTPTKRIDVLADLAAAKAERRPYVIVFVGVNGVGKSTSLSKVAYYIKSNGFVPLLCACDTFRSGAVEQLRVHSQSLEVPLYEKGYGRDAAGIATDGINHARHMGYDAVLVDTAGRMQDNEPLMRALAKLVHVNSPDLVLFVGEALAGNDAVDQVSGFNKALSEFAASRTPRLIDGLVLTKFDTISDKVGAALSLVYTTGKPIVFVGVGQTYADIRNLNVDHVVKALVT